MTKEMMDGLPFRQRQVAELLLQGCTNKDIANDLGIAERTVKAHMAKMFLWFGIGNRSGIKRVRLAVLLNGYTKPAAWPTDRETRIIEAVALGFKDCEITKIVGLGSTRYLKELMRKIYDRLGVWNRVELALWYERSKQHESSAIRDTSSSVNVSDCAAVGECHMER
jgi:DNA-binding NarL/FixJ family response regulator